MPPTKKQKQEVSGVIREWRNRLFLTDWVFQVSYLHEDADSAAASIQMMTEYKSAELTIRPKLWKETEAMRKMILVHELCHCIVQPLVQLACDAGNGCAVSAREIDHWKEAVTQHVTNAAYWAGKDL